MPHACTLPKFNIAPEKKMTFRETPENLILSVFKMISWTSLAVLPWRRGEDVSVQLKKKRNFGVGLERTCSPCQPRFDPEWKIQKHLENMATLRENPAKS